MTTLNDITVTPLSGLNHIDALLGTGPDWNFSTLNNTITYTFSTSVGNETLRPDDPSYLSGSLRTFNANQQAAARTALTYLSSITGIRFVETTDGNAAQVHLAAADLTGASTTGLSSWTGYKYTANGVITDYQVSAYVYLDNIQFFSNNSSPMPGTGGYETLLHELGHTLGLQHPFGNDITLPASQNSTVYTLMSYDHVGGPYTTMRPDDIAALNWLYGGDGLAGALGIGSVSGARYITGSAASDTLTGTAFNDTLRGEQGNDMINGAKGIDTAIFSGTSTGYTFTELAGGLLSVSGADGVDTLDGVEYLQFANGSFSRAELLDTVAPVLTGFGVLRNTNGYVVGNTPNFTGTTEANASVSVTTEVNGIVYELANFKADEKGNFNVASLPLGDGLYSVTAIATDAAGNHSVAAHSNFAVDVVAPTVPTVNLTMAQTGLISGNQAVFSGLGEVGTTIKLFTGTTANTEVVLGTTTVDSSGTWHLTTAPLADGAYAVTTQSLDKADNKTSAADGATRFTVTSVLNHTGTAGDDVMTGSSVNNAFNGMDGIDTVVFEGPRANYTIKGVSGGYTVSSAATGTDSFINVERLQFSDVNVALDVNGNAGDAYRLYAAAFDRAPALEGMGFWLKARDLNIEMDHIAGQFIIGKEFVTKFGVTQTDEQFINRLYDYVLHRPPLAEGLAFWTHALDVGVSREHVLAQFSVSAENRANVAELVANGIEYTPWHG